MSLATGKRIARTKQWTRINMPDHVIQRVEAIALRDKQQLMNSGSPVFEWGPGGLIPDLDDVDRHSWCPVPRRCWPSPCSTWGRGPKERNVH